MKTEFAISTFGSVAALASSLGITDKAVYQWGECVPRLRQFELHSLRPDVFMTPFASKERAA